MSVSTMKKLTVLAYAGDADAIVRKLMNLRCVEIRSSETGTDPGDLSERLDCSEQRRNAETRLAAIRDVLPVLRKYTQRKKTFGRIVHRVNREEFLADGRAEQAWRTVESCHAAMEGITELTAERTRLTELMESLIPWLDYDAPLCETGSAHTSIILGSYPGGTLPDVVRAELSEAGIYAEFVCDEPIGLYAALTVYSPDAEEAERLLASRGFVRASFPDLTVTPRIAYGRAEDRLSAIENELVTAEEHLRVYAEDLDLVEILSDIEETTVNVCRQKQKLAATKNCVLLEGWIPEFAEDRVTGALSRFECACEIAVPEEGEEPPVLLRNNRFAADFEWVIGMYSYPKYGSYDPTFLMSIFYFLIFGLMFADVGYGLILTAACFIGIRLLNPKPAMRRMLSMFGICGISCAVMGVLFGGWFGDLPTAIMENVMGIENAKETAVGRFFNNGLLFNPIDSSMPFLVLSLAVGEVHLIVGMAINMIETCRKKSVAEGLCSTIPFWVLFAGVDLMAPDLFIGMDILSFNGSAAARQTLSELSGIGGYLAIAGVVMILLLKGVGQKSFLGWLTKGLGGLYSLISYASDLLSYSRILALGLVAAVIAQVVNMITALSSSGVIGFIMMVIVLLVGHVMNIAINLLGTFVHAARLQYIEFFGKFYEDGGRPFDPALPAEEYTEEPETPAEDAPAGVPEALPERA